MQFLLMKGDNTCMASEMVGLGGVRNRTWATFFATLVAHLLGRFLCRSSLVVRKRVCGRNLSTAVCQICHADEEDCDRTILACHFAALASTPKAKQLCCGIMFLIL
jgi:hypothetical protein